VDARGARAGRGAGERARRWERGASTDDDDDGIGNGFARVFDDSREAFVAGSRTRRTTTRFERCVDVDVSVERTVEGEDGGETGGDGCGCADSRRAGVERRWNGARGRGRGTTDDDDDDDVRKSG
jgi:hypothetical protein